MRLLASASRALLPCPAISVHRFRPFRLGLVRIPRAAAIYRRSASSRSLGSRSRGATCASWSPSTTHACAISGNTPSGSCNAGNIRTHPRGPVSRTYLVGPHTSTSLRGSFGRVNALSDPAGAAMNRERTCFTHVLACIGPHAGDSHTRHSCREVQNRCLSTR